MDGFLKDIRYAVRSLLKQPGFTLVAGITLALAIGANSAIFTLMDAVLLRPLPVPHPEQLVMVATRTQEGGLHPDFSYPLYQALRDGNDVFAGLLAASDTSFGLNAGDRTERVRGEYTSANYFSALGIQPQLGSAFVASDEAPGAQRVAVISHDLWQRFFGGEAAVLQKTVVLNGRSFAVAGVAPRGFSGLARGLKTDVWITLPHLAEIDQMPDLLNARTTSWLTLIGRLKPGVSVAQAQSRLTAELPDGFEAARGAGLWQAALTSAPGGESFYADQLTQPVKLLLVVVVIILVIACTNVANLLLARAQGRRKEIGIRLALGASRGRIIRQLLTESLLLSLVGGTAGLLIALWANDLSSSIRTTVGGALSFDTGLSRRVLLFTLLLSAITALVFGLVPAIQAACVDVAPVLKDSQTSGSGHRLYSFRNLLVVAQVTLSLVLLIGAGLFLRSLWKLQAIDTGFTGERVLALSLDMQLQGYSDDRGKNFYRDAVDRIAAVPGVQAVSLASALPVTAGGRRMQRPPNQTRPAVDEPISIDIVRVAPRFFETLGLPLMRGRDFRLLDDEHTTKVIIVNESMARKFWPNQDPGGQSFFDGNSTFEVVGVAHDTKYRNLREPARTTMYQPLSQAYSSSMNLLVRGAGDTSLLIPAIRQQLLAIDPRLAVFNLRTLPEHIGRSLYVERMQSLLSTLFGTLALLLTAVGLYGVMAYTVNQRRRELGIRIALGAQRRNILKLVVGQGLVLTLIGVLAGLAGAFALTRLMSSLLFNVAPTDVRTFASVSVLLIVVALLACYVPARRATKVDPLVALRYE